MILVSHTPGLVSAVDPHLLVDVEQGDSDAHYAHEQGYHAPGDGADIIGNSLTGVLDS